MARTHAHSFSSLVGEHAELDRLFDVHQRALIEGNVGTALLVLKTFADELYEHIDYEEEKLLPIFAEEGGETEGATLKIFQAEHQKLRKDAAKLTHKTEQLYATSDLVGGILALLDEETMFKGLFHHHAIREKNLLFPRLDQCTTPEQRERMLGHVA
jgi:iron-sulfur cluster repair protein YtfE (RIC family)